MKKYLFLIATSILLVGCAEGTTTIHKMLGEPDQRIVGKEYTEYNGHCLQNNGLELAGEVAVKYCPHCSSGNERMLVPLKKLIK